VLLLKVKVLPLKTPTPLVTEIVGVALSDSVPPEPATPFQVHVLFLEALL
jgi:hypothetical protein